MGTIKRFLGLCTLVLFYHISWSQPNQVNPDGYNKFYYGDGRISSEGMMREGKPDGYWKTYFVNGQIKSEGNRKDFLLDSLWLFYDENGNVTKKINYARDMKNGYYEVFKLVKDSVEQNVMVTQELYINDLKQGTSYYFYDNGKVHLQINYQDNRKHGEGLEYDENGTIITELKYRNDITIAKTRINRFNQNGEKNGTWKYFHPNGKLQTEAYYKNGKLNGYVKEYDEKGKLISSKRYIEGELFVEKEAIAEKAVIKKEFFDNGKVKSSGAFIKDTPVGVHTTYSKAGTVVESKKYSNTGWVLYKGIVDKKGKRQGDWTYFLKAEK
ncbi:MAG: toxin-antitoxin system YwqK family antitoxin [Chloroflexia bacterium]|nr:toxin-antitoxin system YwqK family antitoxin [Chloroflexia bacterium]